MKLFDVTVKPSNDVIEAKDLNLDRFVVVASDRDGVVSVLSKASNSTLGAMRMNWLQPRTGWDFSSKSFTDIDSAVAWAIEHGWTVQAVRGAN